MSIEHDPQIAPNIAGTWQKPCRVNDIIEPPIDKIVKDHLGGSVHSPQQPFHAGNMLSLHIPPNINCLGFMAISLQPQGESCCQTLKNEPAVKF